MRDDLSGSGWVRSDREGEGGSSVGWVMSVGRSLREAFFSYNLQRYSIRRSTDRRQPYFIDRMTEVDNNARNMMAINYHEGYTFYFLKQKHGQLAKC